MQEEHITTHMRKTEAYLPFAYVVELYCIWVDVSARPLEVIIEYPKIKGEMKFYSRLCLVILECKKEGIHFRGHSKRITY